MSKFPNKTAMVEQATETRAGIAKFANSTTATDTNIDNQFLSPKQLLAAIDTYVPDATSSVEGKGEIATDAEAQAKSVSTNKFVVPSNLAASGFIQWQDTTLTATQIKALATTPITLVTAPAAGSYALFLGATLFLNYAGTNVFTEAGDNLGIKYTDASGVQVCDTIECTGFIDAAADTITNAVPVKDAIVAAASAEAQALVLDNLLANFAGNAGDDNTLIVRVYYVVQDLNP